MNIKIKENDILKKLGMLESAIDLNGKLGKSIGNIAVSDIMDHFMKAENPDGSTWAPLSALTLKYLRKPSDGIAPLRLTTQLQTSVHFTVDGQTVTIRTNRISKYWNEHNRDIAALHHFGGKTYVKKIDKTITVPPRKFMWLSKGSENEIEGLASKIVRDISR